MSNLAVPQRILRPRTKRVSTSFSSPTRLPARGILGPGKGKGKGKAVSNAAPHRAAGSGGIGTRKRVHESDSEDDNDDEQNDPSYNGGTSTKRARKRLNTPAPPAPSTPPLPPPPPLVVHPPAAPKKREKRLTEFLKKLMFVNDTGQARYRCPIAGCDWDKGDRASRVVQHLERNTRHEKDGKDVLKKLRNGELDWDTVAQCLIRVKKV